MAAEVLLHRRREELLLKFQDPWRKVLLYDVFVEQIVTERVAEKLELDTSKPGIKMLLEPNRKQHLKNLQGLALIKLMPVSAVRNLLPFSLSTPVPEEKLGLVVITGGGDVNFEHRTFAEYFLGRWLASHWRQLPRQLLGGELFTDGFRFAAATFNWSLFADLPLHVATARGDEDAVRERLSSSWWTTDAGGRSPLHVAAMTRGGRRGVWDLLAASAGAEDLNRRDDVLGMTAVEYALISENLLLVVEILEGGDTEANRVVKEHAVRSCEIVLSIKKDFADRFDDRGRTLLHLAAAGNHTRAMETLIKIRHEVNVRDNIGATPLHNASEYGHLEAVRLLTDAGADLDVEDFWGYTPLTWAARGCHPEVVQALVERGADFNVKSTLGDTPLSVAAYNGHLEVVKILLDNGADLNGKNDVGDTASMVAAREGHLEVVNMLKEKAADFNI